MKQGKIFRLTISIIPVAFLMIAIAFIIGMYGGDAISGGSQVVLLLSTAVCIWLATWLFKVPWSAFEDQFRENIGDLAMSLMILLLIGALSGAWTVSGIVPSFIYYGVHIISPRFFLITACIISALVSVATGSSWTTIATIGVALLGIGKAEGFSDPLIAGSIISGAYFGDKISPLSDTTVLASSFNKVPLFSHIRYLMVTTIPSFTITLAIFLILGLSHSSGDQSGIAVYAEGMRNSFNISPWIMLVPVMTGIMIARRMPAVVVLLLSALLGIVAAVIFQGDILSAIGEGVTSGPAIKVKAAGIVETLYNSTSIETGNPDVNDLVATRGMRGMLSTVFLIICSMCFGSSMKASGMLDTLASLVLPLTRRRTSLVASTVGTGVLMNGVAGDQYLSIILTSSIFRDIYEKEGYEGKLLSRSIEDSATITSPLIPWNTCGMTQATILGTSTFAYAPYCFFNYISPLMSILIAATGYKIFKAR